MDNEAWKPLIGQVVVIDTHSPYVYVGMLDRVEDHFVILRDVDAHDRSEGASTKEKYILQCKLVGVRPNRKEVSIRKSVVLSVSRLDDVIEY